MKRTAFKVTVFLAAILALFCLVSAVVLILNPVPRGTPEVLFERHVIDQIPPSVKQIEKGGVEGFSERSLYLRFQVAGSDLNPILEKHDFRINEDFDVIAWTSRFKEYGHMEVELTKNWVFYEAKSDRTQKYLFFDRNSTVIFIVNHW